MNAKHTKIQILSLMTLTLLLGTLPSPSYANVISSISSLAPERLGEGWVSTIALSPDGTVIAAAHRTNTTGYRWHTHTVLLWNTQTYEQIGELKIGGIRSMAFSPDGTLLVLGAENHTIYFWDVVERRQLGVINSPGPYSVQYVDFSPDGMLLASSVDSDTSIHLWDVQSRSHVVALNGRAWSAAFSPDGKLIVTGGNRSDPRIKLWDAGTQTQVGALTAHLDITYDLAFSPDGSILASAGGAYDKAVYLWDVDERDQVGVLGGHPAHVGTVAFSPDGKLLASTSYWEPAVFLWDVQTQTQLGQLTNHDVSSGLGWGHQVVFDPDGSWLACSSGNGVEIWNLTAPSVVDFNNDGAVDIDDLLRLIESWGLDDPLVDIGPMPWGDGIVDSRDLLVLAEHMVEYDNHVNDLLVSSAIQPFAKKPGKPGAGGKIDPVLYWVSFPADPLNIYWGDTKITGQIDRPDDPALLVGRTYPDEKAHMQPKNLRNDDDFGFDPGASGGDDFDIAFPDPDPETSYIGPLAVNGTGTAVNLAFKALNRDGKRQSYVLHAEVDPALANWDPLAMNPGDTTTLTLGAWELKGSGGAVAKAVHAWGNFDGQTQILIERQ